MTYKVNELNRFTIEEDLAKQNDGIVILGAGGDPSEWIKGVTEILHKEGIATSADPEKVWSGFSLLIGWGGRRDLFLFFPDHPTLSIGKLVFWRLRFGGCMWISDYIDKYLNSDSDDDYGDLDEDEDEDDWDEDEDESA